MEMHSFKLLHTETITTNQLFLFYLNAFNNNYIKSVTLRVIKLVLVLFSNNQKDINIYFEKVGLFPLKVMKCD